MKRLNVTISDSLDKRLRVAAAQKGYNGRELSKAIAEGIEMWCDRAEGATGAEQAAAELEKIVAVQAAQTG